MVLPRHIVRAASDGDIELVEEWLEAGGAVNDRDEWGSTLFTTALGYVIEERHVDFARWLIARGADVNLGNEDGMLPLHYACYPGDCASSMVLLLLASGARVNARTNSDCLTPLGQLIEEFDYNLDNLLEDEAHDYEEFSEEDHNAIAAAIQRQVSRSGLEIMKLLLRAGASLDNCIYDLSAEERMQEFVSHRPHYANDESFARCRELVAGVRAHGSYKAFAREPHRQFLRLRSLLVRGRAEVRGRTKDSRRLEHIARLPNGACWHVLSFWRDAG